MLNILLFLCYSFLCISTCKELSADFLLSSRLQIFAVFDLELAYLLLCILPYAFEVTLLALVMHIFYLDEQAQE